MIRFIRHYLLAVQFFTRIPVTGRLAEWVGYSPEMLRASAAHFPGIGVVIGGAAAAVFALLLLFLPDTSFTPLVAAALSTVATVWLTGGFHEDGLADVADGLGGSYDRERALEIMKDSRVGAFGAMALVLALLCKVALLALLGSVEVMADAEETPGLRRLVRVCRALAGPCGVAHPAAGDDPVAAACGRHRHVQIQAAGRPDIQGRAGNCVFMVFWCPCACQPCV